MQLLNLITIEMSTNIAFDHNSDLSVQMDGKSSATGINAVAGTNASSVATKTNTKTNTKAKPGAKYPGKQANHRPMSHKMAPPMGPPMVAHPMGHQMGHPMMAPHMMVPHMMVPHMMDPHMMVPHMMGPHIMAPQMMGPHIMGPHIMGTHMVGPPMAHPMAPPMAPPIGAPPCEEQSSDASVQPKKNFKNHLRHKSVAENFGSLDDFKSSEFSKGHGGFRTRPGIDKYLFEQNQVWFPATKVDQIAMGKHIAKELIDKIPAIKDRFFVKVYFSTIKPKSSAEEKQILELQIQDLVKKDT
jgi:hypothetical protein